MLDADEGWQDYVPTSEPEVTGGISNAQATQDEEGWTDVPQTSQPTAQATSDDGWTDVPVDGGEQPSQLGVAARKFAHRLPVGAAAGVAGYEGSLLGGAAGGALLGTALGPGLGTLVGGVVGAVLAGGAAGWLASYGEDEILAAMGVNEPIKKQLAKDEAAYPKTSFISGLAGDTLPAFGLGAVPAAARVVAGGIGAGIEAGVEKYEGHDLDPFKIGASGVANAAFPRPRAWAERVTGAVTPKGVMDRLRTATEKENIGGKDEQPDGPPVQPAATEVRPDYKGPDISFDVAPETPHPLEQAAQRELREPIPTREQMDAANQSPKIGAGVADDPVPPSGALGVGTPGKAGGSTHEAGHDPSYVKGDPALTTGEQHPGVLDKGFVSPDEASALAGKEAQELPKTADVPAREPAPTPHPLEQVRPEPEPHPMEQAAQRELREPVPHPLEQVRTEPEPVNPQQALERFAQPKAPAAEPKVPAKVSQKDINQAAELRAEILAAGHKKIIAALDKEQLNPRQTLEIMRLTKERLMRKRELLETGAKAASPEDAARKTEAMNKWKEAYEQVGPGAEHWKDVEVKNYSRQAKAAARQSWDAVLKHFGGDPFTTKGVYIPDQRTPELDRAIQYISKLRAYVTDSIGPKEFAVLHHAPDAAAADRAIGRTEKGIRKNPQLPEAGEEGQTAVEAWRGDREYFDELPTTWKDRTGKTQSIITESNELRNWVNELKPRDYYTLREVYKETFSPEIRNTEHPSEVLEAMREILAHAEKKRGTKGITATDDTGKVISGEMEGPPKRVKVKPVEEYTMEDFANEKKDAEHQAALAERKKTAFEKAEASKGTKIDRDSEAFKAMAADYEKRANQPLPEKDADRLKHEEAVLKDVDHKWKQMLPDFIKNEAGSFKLPQALKDLMTKQPKSMFSPDADAATMEHVRSLGDEFNNYSKGQQQYWSAVRRLNDMAPYFPSKKVAQKKYEEAYRWLEDHPTHGDDLQIKDEKLFQTVYVARRLHEEDGKLLALIRFYDPEGQIIKIPPASAMNPYEKGFVHRLRMFDATAAESQPDPFSGTNRKLSTWRGPLEDRAFMALSDGKGLRVVFHHDGKGKGIRMWWNGEAVERAVPADFEPHVGTEVTVNVDKKPRTLTVDNATAREIMEHARGDKGEVIKFHENPILAASNAVLQTASALETLKLLRSIRDNKALREHSIFGDAKAAGEKKYIQSDLDMVKELNGKAWYMDRRFAEQFNDYRQAGLNEDSLNGLRRTNVGLIKTLWVASPLIHGFNVGASWYVQRGWDWVTPKGNYWLAKTTFDAIKVTLSQDRSVIDPAMEHGLTLMLPGTKNARILQNAAKKGGQELMRKNPPWWDATIYPEWNLRASDVGKAMLDYANHITWGMSDVMATQRYLENMQRRGMGIKEAVEETHQFIPDYRTGTRVNEKWLGQSTGRLVSKIGREPALSLFGAYHIDLFRQLARITKGTVKGDPKAAGQFMALAVGMFLVYPYLLDRGAEEVTGNKYGNVARRGPLAPAQAISDTIGATAMVNSVIKMLGGTPPKPMINPPKLTTDVYMAPPVIKLGLEARDNKDWTGHQIYPNSFEQAKQMGLGKTAAHIADWALSGTVSPYGMISRETKKRGATVGSVAKGALEEQFGIRDPSPAAIKYQLQQRKNTQREMKYRDRRAGPLERLTR